MRLALITWLAGAAIAFGQTMTQQAVQPVANHTQPDYIHMAQIMDEISDSAGISIDYNTLKDSKKLIMVIRSEANIGTVDGLNKVYRCI